MLESALWKMLQLLLVTIFENPKGLPESGRWKMKMNIGRVFLLFAAALHIKKS